MALRKKHVRRTVFALLFLCVLGPLAALLLYGLWLRTGGMDARLERDLASRLRCKALVRGAHPTGLQTAVADEVELVWQAGEGRLLVVLEDLEAEAGAFGWSVRAARGSVKIAGPDPSATLAAVNQRLVQSEPAPPLVSLVVERLRADLDLGLARLSGEAVAVADGDTKVFRVTFRPALTADAVRLSTDTLEAPHWTVNLLLDPMSDRGVFGGLLVDAKNVPAAGIRQLLGEPEEEASRTAGTFDVSVNWHWPRSYPDKAAVTVRGYEMDLADWTRSVPGGPITGKVQVEVKYVKLSGARAPILICNLKGKEGGLVSAETLRWLEETLPPVRGYGWLLTNSIGYEGLALNFRMTDEGLGCLGKSEDSPPLLVTELFGEEVPILWTTAEPFQVQPVLEKLLPALLPSR